jgi:hypothetical protein
MQLEAENRVLLIDSLDMPLLFQKATTFKN